MPRRVEHRWDLSPREAIALQADLRARVRTDSVLPKIKTIAGGDCAYDKRAQLGYAGWVVYSYPDLEEIQRVGRRAKITFPYVPGLLSFRETPLLLQALDKLERLPDLLILDGHGVAHPRRFGIACHLGLCVDRPTIGCAKSRLVGTHDDPGQEPGSSVALVHNGDDVGCVLRTKRRCKPVFVSAGHRIRLTDATTVIQNCMDGYRIPRPTREADRYVAYLKTATR